MNYTVVGGGIAAVSAVKAIREYDPEGRVTVISDEKHCFYYRPMTPLIIKGDKERDDLLHDHEGIDMYLVHDRAVSLNPEQSTVSLRGGRTVQYDKLLVATGSSPVIPDIPGVKEPNVHYLRTLHDAEQLRRAAKGAGKAVILGGGFVGIKKAEALAHQGVKVTVVEKENTILLPRLDGQGARLIADRLSTLGIRLIMNDTVSEIYPQAKGVKLTSGGDLESDFVCIAVGVKPNIDWLKGSGMETGQAIVVDEQMQSSLPGVYAAGDVVQIRDLVTGRTVTSALWPNAVDMGKVAGTNMAGGKVKYPGGLEVFNATEIDGIAVISVGNVLPDEGDGIEVFRHQCGKQCYRKLVMKGDVLTGAIFIGDIDNAGIYTSLIKTAKPMGAMKDRLSEGTVNFVDYYANH